MVLPRRSGIFPTFWFFPCLHHLVHFSALAPCSDALVGGGYGGRAEVVGGLAVLFLRAYESFTIGDTSYSC